MAQRTETENRTGTDRQQERSGLQRPGDSSRNLTRRDPYDTFGFGPFALMRRMQEDIDRLFGGAWSRSGISSGSEWAEWAPAIDAFQRGNEFVVRADVPGLSRDDLTVEIGDDALTIRGERKYDHQEDREGVFRSERGYGSFCRSVALPDGVMADNAKASFKNGVLEVVMPAPPQEVRRGRRLEIGDEPRADRSGPDTPRK